MKFRTHLDRLLARRSRFVSRQVSVRQLGSIKANPRLERLEDRTVPTVDWIGGNADWHADVNNWVDTADNSHRFPAAGDDVQIANGATVAHATNSDTVNSLLVAGGSTLNLSGGMLTDSTNLDASAGTFKLSGGTLASATAPAGTTITVSAGTLIGVTVSGILDLSSVNGAYSYVTGGLTLNGGTINLGSVGASPKYGYLDFSNAGSQMIGGTGTVNFGDNSSNGIYFHSGTASDKLTIASGVTVQGSSGLLSSNAGFDFLDTVTSDPTTVGSALSNSTITITGTNWLNEGTLQALHGGILNLQGTWSGAGAITETNSTLNLQGQFPTSSVSGLTRSGGTVNLNGKLLNSGSTLILNDATGSWILQGSGIIDGGTLEATSGNALRGATGTLNAVTLDGTGGNASPLDLSSVNNAYVYISGGLTLNNGTINLGSVGAAPTAGNLYFYNAGSQSVAGTGGIVKFGDNTSNGINFNSNTASDVLTIAPGITVEGANGTLYANAAIDFHGTIDGDPTTVGSALVSTLSINGANWLNEGTLEALHGGALTLQGTWSNTGTITQTNSTLTLAGQFSTSSVSGLTRSGGTVNVNGKLLNSGNTLILNDATGSWILQGSGIIDGGTLKATAGNALLGANGTLNAVTLDGTGGNASPLDLSSVNNAYVYVTGGLTLNNGTINLGSVGAGAKYGTLYFYYAGPQTIGGTGTINFGDSSNNGIDFYSGTPSDKLIIASGVTVQGANGAFVANAGFDFQGTIDGDPTTVGSALAISALTIGGTNWQSEGTFEALHGGALTLQGTWSNTGTITETNSTLTLAGQFPASSVSGLTRSGGTVNVNGKLLNSGNTLILNDATGSWILQGSGIIDGGTLKATAGNALLGANGTLNAVTLDGTGGNASPLDLSSVNNAYVYVTGGLTLNNGTINLGSVGAGAKYGTLYFYYAGPQTITGTGGIVKFGDSSNNGFNFYSNVASDVLTIAPGITLEGANGSIYANAAYDFQGTIDGDPTTVGSALSGTTLSLNTAKWTNDGTIEVQNGGKFIAQGTLTNIAAGTLTGGNWLVSGGGTVRLNAVDFTTNAANIVVDGASSNFYADSGTTSALAYLGTNAATGSLTIRNGQSFTTNGPFNNLGSVTVGSGSQLTVGSQYASSVIAFSSQYSTSSWSAAQALGPPNTFSYGDIATAWTASSANGTQEYLTLGFATPTVSEGVVIRETYGNGYVTEVDAIDTSDVVHTVWSGTDPSQPGTPVDFFASWPLTSYDVKAVTIHVNTNHSSSYEELDSVALVSPTTTYAQTTGSTTIEAGGTLSLPTAGNFVQTGGTTTIDGDLTTTGQANIQAGLLQGSGVITADVTNAGVIDPGPSTAALTIDGDYSQTATGALNIQIGGLAAGTQYDQFAVNGDVSLDGALNVSLLDGFVPAVGDKFLMLNNLGANAIGGDFGYGEGTTFLVGGVSKFHITYASTELGGTGNDVLLTASNIAPTLDAIPDPDPILENAGQQTIDLSGITAGGGETQNLIVTATSNNPAVVPDPTVTYTSPDATGSLSYTPTANKSGVAVITVTVMDDAGAADGGIDTFTRTFSVQVGHVNHAPSFTEGADVTVLEDAGPQSVPGWATDISVGPPEDNGQTLTFLVSTDNDALFSSLPSIDPATGTLTFTPTANANGTATVTVRLMDNGGTDNNGTDTSEPQTFVIAVTAVNDAPSFVKGTDQSIQEDAGPQSIPGWATNISAGPPDESGQVLSFHLSTDNDSLFSALPSIDAGGNLSYTPAANANGSATVTVNLEDDGGTDYGGVDTFTQTFNITVAAVNDAPMLDTTGTPMLPFIPVLGKVLPEGGPISDLTKFVTDVDAGAVKGVAVTAADNTHGQWWYNLTGVEADWTLLPAVTPGDALLLPDNGIVRVRFVPKKGFTGFASLTFKAWDQSNNATDTRVSTNTSFSSDSDRAWIAVGKPKTTVDPEGETVLKPVLPVYKPTSKLVPLAAVKAQDLLGIAGLEADTMPKGGLGVAILAVDSAEGTWQYKRLKLDTSFQPIVVGSGTILLLRPTDQLRYVPNTLTPSGAAPLTFKTWDPTAGVGTAGTSNLSPTGTGFGKDPGTAVLDLTPILALSVPAILNPVDAGATSNEATFSSLMSASRVGSNLGVAITRTTGTGTWEYLPVGGTWTAIGKVSAGKALFLDENDEVRFTAASGAKPGTASLSFKAWDETKLATGSLGSAAGTSVSKETKILTVAVANHAPVLGTAPITLPAISLTSKKPNVGVTVKTLLGKAFSDPDSAKPALGIALTAADNSNGVWQYSLDGRNWINVGAVSAGSAILLTDTNKVRFVPNAGYAGSATIGYEAWDRTAGQAGDRGVDTTGLLNSFSGPLDVVTATIVVTA